MGTINKTETFGSGINTIAGLNANFDTVYSEFNGNIEDANIKALANIQQSKILNLVTDLALHTSRITTEINVVTFTGNGTYTKPSDLIMARVLCQAAGGGGGGVAAAGALATRAAGGGGGGGYGEKWLMAA